MNLTYGGSDTTVQDLVDQLNAHVGAIGIAPNGAYPNGAVPGTPSIQSVNGGVILNQADSRGRFGSGAFIPNNIPRNIGTIPAGLYLYTGLTTSALPPSTTDLPSDGSWGWHYDTLGLAYYFAYNASGTVVFPNFLGISGSLPFTRLSGALTLAQHGDLSGDTSTKHKFQQISGTITATQHGTLSTGTLHPFTVISGSITDAQHGARGNISGTAHDLVTTTDAGFMSDTDKIKLNNITNTGTATNVLNCTHLNVLSTRVVDQRQTGWSMPTGTPNRTTFDTNDITLTVQDVAERLFALIQDLSASLGHGLIDA